MMIEEFRYMQKSKEKPINPRDYKLVEFVYTYHPLNLSKQAAKIETELKIAKQNYWNKSEEYNSLGEWENEEYDLEI